MKNNSYRTMRKLLTLTILFISAYCSGQSLRIILYNKTGFTVDSLYIDNTRVGAIPKGDSIVVTNCKRLTMQGEDLMGGCEGIIKGKTPHTESGNTLRCATGVHSETSGTYRFDIDLLEYNDGYRLVWGRHNVL
jgi:hypothetical protein